MIRSAADYLKGATGNCCEAAPEKEKETENEYSSRNYTEDGGYPGCCY